MDYKISKEMIAMFLLNVMVMAIGIYRDEAIVICTSVIISVILSVSVQIMEEIHKVN